VFDSNGYIHISHQEQSYFLENINTICPKVYWLIFQVNHFGNQQLFTKTKVNTLLEKFEFNRIRDEENSCLITELTEEEIKRAVWDCESLKCPGPDGIDFGFIKEFWEVIKEDFKRFISEFHSNGCIGQTMLS
jgi:hypothetical protein